MQFTKLRNNQKKSICEYIYIHAQRISSSGEWIKDENTVYMMNKNSKILLKEQDCTTQQCAH